MWRMMAQKIEALVRAAGMNPFFRREPKRILENSGARSLIRSRFYGQSIISPSSNCSRNTTEANISGRLMKIPSKYESLPPSHTRALVYAILTAFTILVGEASNSEND